MPKIKSLDDLKSKSSGKWQLDNHHRLTYSSQDEQEQFELEASLVAAEPDTLVVSVTQKQERGRTVTSLVKIDGTWQANDANQIEFEVAGQSDRLTFKGSWTLNENYELIYTYRTRKSKGRTVQLQTLTFKGFWDLSEKNRLVYLIEGDSASAFRFRGAFQTTSILAKKGEIRYLLGEKRRVSPEAVPTQKMSAQVGVEAAGEKGRVRTITFFGKFKLSDQCELEFELECGDRKKRVLKFGAEFQVTDSSSITAQLIASNGKSLGVEVVFHKSFFEGRAQAFVRLRKTLQENAIEAGVTLSF